MAMDEASVDLAIEQLQVASIMEPESKGDDLIPGLTASIVHPAPLQDEGEGDITGSTTGISGGGGRRRRGSGGGSSLRGDVSVFSPPSANPSLRRASSDKGIDRKSSAYDLALSRVNLSYRNLKHVCEQYQGDFDIVMCAGMLVLNFEGMKKL
jgi:hypothetical protein